MSEINDNELLVQLVGGVSISGTLINAFTGGIKIILEVGRSFGTAIRRIKSGSICKAS